MTELALRNRILFLVLCLYCTKTLIKKFHGNLLLPEQFLLKESFFITTSLFLSLLLQTQKKRVTFWYISDDSVIDGSGEG